MEHPPHPGERPDHRQAVGMGLPVVDDHRQVQLLRQVHLVPEDLLLKRPGRVLLPVVVQADLPDGHRLGPLEKIPEDIQVLLPAGRAVLRVVPRRRVDVGPALRECRRRPGAGQVAPRVYHQGHPLVREGREDRVPVRVEFRVVVVGMGVEEHSSPSFYS